MLNSFTKSLFFPCFLCQSTSDPVLFHVPLQFVHVFTDIAHFMTPTKVICCEIQLFKYFVLLLPFSNGLPIHIAFSSDTDSPFSRLYYSVKW